MSRGEVAVHARELHRVRAEPRRAPGARHRAGPVAGAGRRLGREHRGPRSLAARPGQRLLRRACAPTAPSPGCSTATTATRSSFDYLFSRNFLQHVQTRLPRYLDWFQEAAAKHERRLAAARRDGLPGIEVGPVRRLVHRRARPHATHRGHGRDDARGRPARPAGQHLRRRALPVAPAAHGAAAHRRSPTAPGSRWPPTTSASATSRTRASSRSSTDAIRTAGRTCASSCRC